MALVLQATMNPLNSLSKWVTSGLSGKTSWEWLELLIVPLGLAIGAFYLDSQVEGRQERIATERYEQERNIADERAKQEILDSYLEKMQGLLLDRNLRKSSEDSEVRSVARAITTTAIKDLDATGNALLLDFLQESNLVSSGSLEEENTKESIVILPGLNLSNAALSGANLSAADLNGADLNGANLRAADLNGANLSAADLNGANLRAADLNDATLRYANLGGANLGGADLLDADLSYANLRYANLSEANLCSIRLSGTSQRCITLIHAFLRGVDQSLG